MGKGPDTDCSEDMVGSIPAVGASLSPVTQRWYVYCVEDNGIGVVNGDLCILTKAYRQVSQGPCKMYQGTGLGLSISKTHVDAMLGGLGVASTFTEEGRKGGGGTLFAAAVPLRCPASEVELAELGILDYPNKEVKIDAEALAAEAAGTLGKITGDACFGWGDKRGDGENIITGPRKKVAFFVVDDHIVNVKLLEKKIKKMFENVHGEVQVLAAADGLTALEMLTTTQDGEPNPTTPPSTAQVPRRSSQEFLWIIICRT